MLRLILKNTAGILAMLACVYIVVSILLGPGT